MWILILILLVLILFWLWLAPAKKGPKFDEIERPRDNFVEPPGKEVAINVQRDSRGIPVDLTIEPRDLLLEPGQQAAWRGGASRGDEGGRIEIRFSPNSTPFGGAAFTTARGGVALSGTPVRSDAGRTPGRYIILLTTPDGYLLFKPASLTVSEERPQPASSYQKTATAQRRVDGDQWTRVVVPDFELIERPKDNFVEPRRKEVTISIVRDERGEPQRVVVEPENLVLSPNEQAAWSTSPSEGSKGGKIEILFNPNNTPFGGREFITARGGTALSGKPVAGNGVYEYTVLITTPDGFIRESESKARVTVSI
jgi:hypothetical protein